MEKTAKGTAFVFGKNIDTDQIYPGRFVELTDVEDVAKHAMEGADPNFVKEFKKGDIIVATTNFGCGSSREHAAITLKAVGAGAILAESFGRIFYRNAINLGVPLLVCPGIGDIARNGDIVSVNVETGNVINETTGKTLQAQPMSEYVMNILAHGGIKSMIKKQLEGK
jgi:3-isopropylmalate/(R)-2-methylmalate dehydratase small subunit